jgi:hypothetical protein
MIIVKYVAAYVGHPDEVEDSGCAGTYIVAVDAAGDDPNIAGIAGDAFHYTYAIGDLDPWIFTVYDLDCKILEEPEDYENGSGKDQGTILCREDEFSVPDIRDMIWVCPDCKRVVLHDYDALCEVGTPICGDCDCDMERLDQ